MIMQTTNSQNKRIRQNGPYILRLGQRAPIPRCGKPVHVSIEEGKPSILTDRGALQILKYRLFF